MRKLYKLLFIVSLIFSIIFVASCSNKTDYEKLNELKKEYNTDYFIIGDRGITNYNNKINIDSKENYNLPFNHYFDKSFIDDEGNIKDFTYSIDYKNLYITSQYSENNNSYVSLITYDILNSSAIRQNFIFDEPNLDIYETNTDSLYDSLKDPVKAYENYHNNGMIVDDYDIPSLDNIKEKSNAYNTLKSIYNEYYFDNPYLFITENNDKFLVVKAYKNSEKKIDDVNLSGLQFLDTQFVFNLDEDEKNISYVGYSLGNVLSIVPIIHQFSTN